MLIVFNNRLATWVIVCATSVSYIAALFVGTSDVIAMYFVPWHFILLPVFSTASIVYIMVGLVFSQSMKFDLLNVLTLIVGLLIIVSAIFNPLPYHLGWIGN